MMEPTIESMAMYRCQRTKESVYRNRKDFFEFVPRVLNHEETVKAINSVLPFDNVVNAQLRIVDGTSQIKSIGISVMRMELEPATFSLGITVEIFGSRYNKAASATEFVIGCQPIEKIQDYVKGEEFARQTLKTFDQLVEDCFYPKEIKKQVWW
jgi:hypothetical protein